MDDEQQQELIEECNVLVSVLKVNTYNRLMFYIVQYQFVFHLYVVNRIIIFLFISLAS